MVIRRFCLVCDRFTVSVMRENPHREICGEHWDNPGPLPIWPRRPIVVPAEVLVALVANGRDNT